MFEKGDEVRGYLEYKEQMAYLFEMFFTGAVIRMNLLVFQNFCLIIFFFQFFTNKPLPLGLERQCLRCNFQFMGSIEKTYSPLRLQHF